ncbi:ABC transporter ATP-binding protein [Halobacterium sp. R2-5]|uniref:ABC transporter ATP-binding protein n=1 Tax=Halobacterium sp. R2-5 TaxID=2715751 RepID=UPI00141FA0C0|nr:ABC transporter ATP-binding protein [Halobacterium sp. R2-5]NIB99189.1 ABC transporter ATP-binding protein [Halobacterium sp. R2-5]
MGGGNAPAGDEEAERSGRDAVASVSDLSKSFGDVDVLDAVSFSLPANATTAVVGPNGCGKTTLVELLTGVESPTAGDVTLSPSGERPVGYLPQAPRFQPSATVRETVAFYARLLSTDVDPDAALDTVGLREAADRRTDALSGGMRRLLGIAVGLLGSPPLVVLDEPTSGLDPTMTRYVFDVVTDLSAAGQSVVFTTHDLSRAAAADHLLVLAEGGVVAEGAPDDVVAESGTDSLADAFDAATGGREVSPAGGSGE